MKVEGVMRAIFRLFLNKFLRYIFCMTILVGAAGIPAPAVKADGGNGWLGANFLDLVDRKIVYDHWGYIDDFRTAFEAIDSAHHLMPDSQPATLLNTDLVIFTLRNWGDVANIPHRFADLGVILEQVDVSSSDGMQAFDIIVGGKGKQRKIRIYFVSLSDVGPKNNTDECLIRFIYATSVFKDQNAQLKKLGCKGGGT